MNQSDIELFNHLYYCSGLINSLLPSEQWERWSEIMWGKSGEKNRHVKIIPGSVNPKWTNAWADAFIIAQEILNESL